MDMMHGQTTYHASELMRTIIHAKTYPVLIKGLFSQ